MLSVSNLQSLASAEAEAREAAFARRSQEREESARYAYLESLPPFDSFLPPGQLAVLRAARELSVDRARSLSPVPSCYRSSTYRYYHSRFSPSFSSQVHSYATHLDNEETTRSYMNNLRSDFYSRRAAMGLDASGSQTAERYRSDVDTRDLYTYKHYRKSNATLEDRNARAKSPILGRELDRYYKTERRSDYLGDVSSGGVRDFRHYNYRAVPYYGGSDYYAYVPRIIKTWNNEIYPWYLPSHCGN